MLCNLFLYFVIYLYLISLIIVVGCELQKKLSSENTLNGGTLSSAKWCCDFVDGEQRTVLVKCTKVKAFICLALFHILGAIEIVD